MRMFRHPANRFRTRILGHDRSYAIAASDMSSTLWDDVRLFALTFGAGFLFMAVYLA